MTKQKKLEFAIVGIALVAIFILAAAPAKALNVKAAGVVQHAAPAAVDTFTFSGPAASDIPNGILIWASDGAKFWIRRGISATAFETVPMPIPEGASMVIPLRASYRTGGTWYQRIEVYCATDTVFGLPVIE